MDREWAVQRYLHGESATAICASLGCSRAWLYRWIARYVTDDPTWAASRLRGAARFYSLHSVDVATCRVAVEPLGCRQAQAVINAFWASWQRLGLPTIQQIDNEPVFYGNRARPRGFGPLIRLCLSVGVQPWFIPVAEPWAQRCRGTLQRLVAPDRPLDAPGPA